MVDRSQEGRFAWIDNRPKEPRLRTTYSIAKANQIGFEVGVNRAFKRMQNSLPEEQRIRKIIRDSLTPGHMRDQIMADMQVTFQKFGEDMARPYEKTILDAATHQTRVLDLAPSEVVRPSAMSGNQRYVSGLKVENFLRDTGQQWAATLSQEKGTQILELIQQGIADDLNSRAIARQLIDTDLQLLPRHAQAVERSSNALRRTLQRKNEERVLEGRRRLSSADIEKRVAAHKRRETARLKKYRARSIARTEVIRAEAQGTVFGWQEAQKQGRLAGDAQMVWIAAASERTCPVCLSLDGKTVAISNGGDFQASYTEQVRGIERTVNVDAPLPPAHTMCRCSIGVQ